MSQSYPSQTRQGMDPAGAGRRLLLERLLHDALQFAALVQLADDVAAADELAVHVDLRDRRPVGEALDRVALLGRAQNIDRVERLAEVPEDLRRRRRGPALPGGRGTFHGQDQP